MTRITSHPRTNPDKLNFFEWLFLRRFSVAWNMAAGTDKITKTELLDIGIGIVHP